MTLRVIAHRGAPTEAAENSLESVRRAVHHRADLVEIDVRTTRDGVVVLHHDDDLRRSAGRPQRVEDLDFAALRALPLFRDAGGGAPAPTLAEAIDAAAGTPLAVEVKAPPGPTAAAEAAATARAVAQRLATSPSSAIISFERLAIEAALGAWPALRCGLIRNRDQGPRGWRDSLDLPTGIAVLSRRIADAENVAALRAAGKEVWVYSLDDEESIRAFAALRVHGFISNRPDVARRVVDALSQEGGP